MVTHPSSQIGKTEVNSLRWLFRAVGALDEQAKPFPLLGELGARRSLSNRRALHQREGLQRKDVLNLLTGQSICFHV